LLTAFQFCFRFTQQSFPATDLSGLLKNLSITQGEG
jgi:hypothetical protein